MKNEWICGSEFLKYADNPLYEIWWNDNYTSFRAVPVLPKCTCRYTDVDVVDVFNCELHDPESEYNLDPDNASPVAAGPEFEPELVCAGTDDDPFTPVPVRKPMGHEHVAEPFRAILNSIGGVR